LNVERAVYRLLDIKEAIRQVRLALNGMTYDQLLADSLRLAAFERFLEIISEASRHVPLEWKQTHGAQVPWQNIASIGNVLRHAYPEINYGVLWDIKEVHLAQLELAVQAMLDTHDPERRFQT